jgi:putative ABC transport system permease protein
MVNQRTREISIRSVLGANTTRIVILFGKEFILLITISFVIFVPVIYYAINQWLTSFANRMNISFSIFFIPFLIVLTVSALTIFSQVIRAARANPVDNLRYE